MLPIKLYLNAKCCIFSKAIEHILSLRIRFACADQLFALAILYVNRNPLKIVTTVCRDYYLYFGVVGLIAITIECTEALKLYRVFLKLLNGEYPDKFLIIR